MELILFVLQLILGVLAFFAITFIIGALLVLAQDMDRRRAYGDKYADCILINMHKASHSK